jgi:hypothetical protein
MVKVKPGAKVITIERAQNVLTIERVVELFSTAFEQTCTLKVIDKLVVNCLTRELTAAEVMAVLEEQERLLRLFFRITAASSRSSGRSGAVSVVLRFILRVLLIRRTRVRSRDASRTSTGSSSIILGKFPEWLKGKLGEYKEWFNHSRFHTEIKARPADLYKCNVRKLT